MGAAAPALAAEPRAADSSAADPRSLVERFVGLFDRHALDSLLVMVHEEIEWYGIEGGTIRSQTRGKKALARDLADYFEGCPTCHSTVEVGQVNGRFVSAVETATWDHVGRRFVQRSSCVYEIEDGLVRRVWYFPSVRP